MELKSFKINNLRNIGDAEIDASGPLMVFVGDNGAGKTTVLEGLVILAKGRSFRSARTASLIGPLGDAFTLLARVTHQQGADHSLGLEKSTQQWRARRDGTEVSQLSQLAADLPLVLLEPNSHALISGGPEIRRRHLDWGVFHVEHAYLEVWRRYARAVKQRNAALRRQDRKLVASLDPQVSELGTRVHRARQAQAEELGAGFQNLLSTLGPELPEVGCRYRPGWTGERLAEALQGSLVRDLEQGATGPGPHRADLHLTVRGKPAREQLSRGEQKLVAAALLLAQAQIMARDREPPLLLLDDVASEFDRRHLSRVLESASACGGQLWLTGVSPEPLLETAREAARVFHVEHGKIHEETDT